MLQVQIVIYPGHKVVLEDAFDELMKQVRRKEHVDISAGETVRKWLQNLLVKIFMFREHSTYQNVSANPVFIPQKARIKVVDHKVGLFMASSM